MGNNNNRINTLNNNNNPINTLNNNNHRSNILNNTTANQNGLMKNKSSTLNVNSSLSGIRDLKHLKNLKPRNDESSNSSSLGFAQNGKRKHSFTDDEDSTGSLGMITPANRLETPNNEIRNT